MRRTVKYTTGEIGRARVVEDFLPPPDELVAREDAVRVTLSRRSIDFFKRAARRFLAWRKRHGIGTNRRS